MDQQTRLPLPRMTYYARAAMTLTHLGFDYLIPVSPPAKLEPGESLVVWWVIDSTGIRYEHAGSPRR